MDLYNPSDPVNNKDKSNSNTLKNENVNPIVENEKLSVGKKSSSGALKEVEPHLLQSKKKSITRSSAQKDSGSKTILDYFNTKKQPILETANTVSEGDTELITNTTINNKTKKCLKTSKNTTKQAVKRKMPEEISNKNVQEEMDLEYNTLTVSDATLTTMKSNNGAKRIRTNTPPKEVEFIAMSRRSAKKKSAKESLVMDIDLLIESGKIDEEENDDGKEKKVVTRSKKIKKENLKKPESAPRLKAEKSKK